MVLECTDMDPSPNHDISNHLAYSLRWGPSASVPGHKAAALHWTCTPTYSYNREMSLLLGYCSSWRNIRIKEMIRWARDLQEEDTKTTHRSDQILKWESYQILEGETTSNRWKLGRWWCLRQLRSQRRCSSSLLHHQQPSTGKNHLGFLLF